MVVQHNLSAMNANRYLGINNSKLSKSLEKLSSGYAINRAGDNAAGLAVSEKMRSQIAGMTQAVKNAQDGISMVQTFEGALTETDSILQRMKTLADQMANGTYDDPVDRTAAQQEFLQLNDELDQIADTDFNGVVVLNGGRMSDGTEADPDTGLIKYVAGDTAAATTKTQIAATDITEYDGVTADKAAPDMAQAQVGDVNTFNKGTYKAAVADLKGPTDVTYAYAGDGKWINNYNETVSSSKETGGFVGVFGETITLDDTGLAVGDTVTVTVTPGVEGTKQEVKNWDADLEFANGLGTNSTADGSGKFEITYTGNDQAVLDAIAKLNGATVVVDAADAVANGGVAAAGDITVTTNGATAADITIQANGKPSAPVAAGDIFSVTEDGKVTFYQATAALAVNTVADLTAHTEIGSLTLDKFTNDTTADNATYTLQTAMQAATAGAPAEVKLKAGATVSDGDKEAFVERINKGVQGGTNVEVSKSNAFKQSEAMMTYKSSIILQTGARTKDAVEFTFQYNSDAIGELAPDLDCTASGLGTKDLNLNTQASANLAIDKIDQAINKVSLVRGTFGAIQNRLEHKIDNLNVSVENLTSAESQIRDTNMPQEMMNFTKQQILAQASQSMLAQANQLPQGVLSLLQ